MANLINETFNLNVTSPTPIPTPHTDGGEEIVNGIINGAAAPDTGFGEVVNQIGPVGCSMIIVCLALLIGSIVFFCFRNKFHNKTLINMVSCGTFAFAVALAVPSLFLISSAINSISHTTTLNVSTESEQPVVSTVDATFALPEQADYGYTLTAYIDGVDTSLHNKDKSSKVAATTDAASDPAAMTLNSYGIKNPKTGAYGSLSTDPQNPTVLYDTDAATPVGAPIVMNYATKLDSTILTDTYTGKIVYNITIKPKPTPTWDNITYLQEMTPEICASQPKPAKGATTAPTRTLIDSRDQKVYTVSKLADGNCWMTDNLRLGSANHATTLTPADSNVASSYVLPAMSVDTSWTYNLTRPQFYPDDSRGSDGYYYGYYYNYNAASAGTDTGQTAEIVLTSDLCPKGWKMPRSYEATADYSFSQLFVDAGVMNNPAAIDYAQGGYNILTSAPMRFAKSGMHFDTGTSLSIRDTEGRYWTADGREAHSAHMALFNNGNVKPLSFDDKGRGYVIRCVAFH